MTQKAETTFSKLLHSKLDASVYVEKTNNPYRKGTPDFYYEGNNTILWAEHKHIKAPWVKDLPASQVCKSKSWPAQRKWLERAHNSGQHTCVVVGVGSGRSTKAYVLPYPYNFSLEYNRLLSLVHTAEYIESKITNETTVCNVDSR